MMGYSAHGVSESGTTADTKTSDNPEATDASDSNADNVDNESAASEPTNTAPKQAAVRWTKEDEMGIIPRIVKAVFRGIRNGDDMLEYTVQVSYVEIYLEKVRDLLNPAQDNLKIREGKKKGIYIDGVTDFYVGSFNDVLRIMKKGDMNRSIAATRMNAKSSRSHSVFIMTVTQRHTQTNATKTSKLIMVDLAGSEKVRKTGASGLTLLQAQHTNKSLAALGNVINSLTESRSHIPYRDSKLTRLLTDSLGGNSKTCLIITCSPSMYNLEETFSTLRFGMRAKSIKNKPRVNQERTVEEYKKLLGAAKRKIREQGLIIEALESDIKRIITMAQERGVDVSDFKYTSPKDIATAHAAAQRAESAARSAAMTVGGEARELARQEIQDDEAEDSVNDSILDSSIADGASLTTGSPADAALMEELQSKLQELRHALDSQEEAREDLADELLQKDSELDSRMQELEELRQDIEAKKVQSKKDEFTILELREDVARHVLDKKTAILTRREREIEIEQLRNKASQLTSEKARLEESVRELRHLLDGASDIAVPDIAASVAAAEAAQQPYADPPDSPRPTKAHEQLVQRVQDEQLHVQQLTDELDANRRQSDQKQPSTNARPTASAANATSSVATAVATAAGATPSTDDTVAATTQDVNTADGKHGDISIGSDTDDDDNEHDGDDASALEESISLEELAAAEAAFRRKVGGSPVSRTRSPRHVQKASMDSIDLSLIRGAPINTLDASKMVSAHEHERLAETHDRLVEQFRQKCEENVQLTSRYDELKLQFMRGPSVGDDIDDVDAYLDQKATEHSPTTPHVLPGTVSSTVHTNGRARSPSYDRLLEDIQRKCDQNTRLQMSLEDLKFQQELNEDAMARKKSSLETLKATNAELIAQLRASSSGNGNANSTLSLNGHPDEELYSHFLKLRSAFEKLRGRNEQMRRREEYQAKLIDTRREHIEVLEDALRESNQTLRKHGLDHAKKTAALEAEIQRLREMLDSTNNNGTAARANHPKVVVPLSKKQSFIKRFFGNE
jgi:Kinesin motor domain